MLTPDKLKPCIYPEGHEDKYVIFYNFSLHHRGQINQIHKFVYSKSEKDKINVLTFDNKEKAATYINQGNGDLRPQTAPRKRVYEILTIREYIEPELQMIYKLKGEITRTFKPMVYPNCP